LETFKNKIASFLFKIGISADFATYLGLFFAFLCGIFTFLGRFYWAGSFLLLSGWLDLMDGAIARAAKKPGYFGGILDSSFDRYGDGFIFSGILFYCVSRQKFLYAALSMSALLGSFLISYVRARAECAIEKCKVGFWERGERLVYIVLGFFLNNLGLVLWVLGVGVHLTAVYRLHTASQNLKQTATDLSSRRVTIKDILFHSRGRGNLLYAAKVIFLALLVLIYRPAF